MQTVIENLTIIKTTKKKGIEGIETSSFPPL